MEAVNSIYKEVKKMFQTAVPPYVATVNDDYHYEVWAIKKQAGESQVSEELLGLSLIHISEPTRQAEISYAVFCLKKKK